MVALDIIPKPDDFNPNSRNISNSEAISFLTCKRMYDFTFIDNLAPVETSRPLQRGTLGHLCFERYIYARLNNSNHESALSHARTALTDAIQQGTAIDLVGEVQHLWDRYMAFHKGWPEWNLLGTEERVDLTLTDSLRTAIRYDLYIEEKDSGRRGIGDWKFTFDFWSDDDHYLNPQMPKYIAVMRLNKIQCDFGFIEEIRTRKIVAADKLRDPKNLWRRRFYSPSNPKLKQMLYHHVRTAQEIERHRALSEEDRIADSIPVLNKYGACSYCDFKMLCNSMNEGINELAVAKSVHYKLNEYAEGYNPTVTTSEELNL